MNNIRIINQSNQGLLNNNIKKDCTINEGHKKSFEEIFHSVKSNDRELKFSKHAQDRMNLRNINLSNEQISRIEVAMKKAESKGIKEALILMGDTAFIASVKSKTIITTANAEQLKDNVFTNIDGAVII